MEGSRLSHFGIVVNQILQHLAMTCMINEICEVRAIEAIQLSP